VGQIPLRIPKLRQGSYFPSLLEPRRRAERALVSVVQEAYVAGVSTRKVDDLVRALGLEGCSRSEVSRICRELDEAMERFRSRPLEGEYPYVWLDAKAVRVRYDGRVVHMAAVVAIGVRQDGSREVLGFNVGASETYEFWAEFLRPLVGRGLRGVRLVISDAHEGLRRAISEILAGASWQRSRVHFMRNVLQKLPRHAQGPIAALVRTIFASRGPGGGRAAAGPGLRHPAAPVPPSRPHAPGGRRGSPHVHALPPGALAADPLHQPPGAPEPGARSTVRCGGDLPEPTGGPAVAGRGPGRAP
jgi:putative transposase